MMHCDKPSRTGPFRTGTIGHWVYNALILISLLSPFSARTQDVVAKEGSYGIDKANGLIVWHQKNLDSLITSHKNIRKFTFGHTFKRVDDHARLSYSEAYRLQDGGEMYDLYITKIPIVNIKVNKDIKDEVKVLGYFSYFSDDRWMQRPMGIEHRGNLSLTFPKKSYDLEFWTDSIHKIKQDVKFQGLKTDDDWILDGLYNEPLRLRSTLANKLWKEVHQPRYRIERPKARSGVDVRYVELFKNGSYQGLYALSESVGRPLLELKEHDQKQVRGELFKASSYEGAPSFLKAPKYNNLFPHWGGFKMEYPILDYRSHWQNLYSLLQLVVNSGDKEFIRDIGNHIDIDNVIDYFLFVNLLRATDNLGKNYYLARYDENSPYFFVPWDLDGVMGIIQDGKRIPTTDDLLSNGLFDRLLRLDPDGLNQKLKERWAALRKAEYSNDTLMGKIVTMYSDLRSNKVYDRERKIWPDTKTEENHLEYLQVWLKDRLAFLDRHFKNMPSALEGGTVR